MTNADRLLAHIAKHGKKHIKIYPVPGSQFWIVAEKRAEDDWRVTICNPMKTTTRLVSDHVKDSDSGHLWTSLLKISAVKRMKDIASRARKCSEEYYITKRKHKNTYDPVRPSEDSSSS